MKQTDTNRQTTGRTHQPLDRHTQTDEQLDRQINSWTHRHLLVVKNSVFAIHFHLSVRFRFLPIIAPENANSKRFVINYQTNQNKSNEAIVGLFACLFVCLFVCQFICEINVNKQTNKQTNK